MNDIALTEDERTTVNLILKAHVPDCAVWAFGSRVSGTHKPWSDLDIAILTAEPLPVSTRAALENAFTDSDLPFKVDIVDWAQTGEPFRQLIQRKKVLLV